MSWLYLVRSFAVVLLLSGIGGHALAADNISVPLTFISAGVVDCDAEALPGVGIDVPGVGCFSQWDKLSRKWPDADAYCSSLGGGYALPSKEQLDALYAAHPNGQLNAMFGWMLNDAYVSSTQGGTAGTHYHVALNQDYASADTDIDDYGYVSCVRATAPVSPPGCESTGAVSVDVPGTGLFTPTCQGMVWSTANTHCNNMGNGYRLPSRDELLALYNANPNNQMYTVYGWPTNLYYWSSTQNTGPDHYGVHLLHGGVGDSSDANGNYVACVR